MTAGPRDIPRRGETFNREIETSVNRSYQKMKKALITVAAALLIHGTAANLARAATLFSATLDESQENPPTGVLGTGTSTLSLNNAQDALTIETTITGIDFTGTQSASTTDNLTAFHIHNAPAGTNGGVVFGMVSPNHDVNPNNLVVTPFATGVGGTVSSIWDLTEGNNTTLAVQLSNLLADNLYLNVHTTGNGGGAIRGQINVVPLPAAAWAGLALLGGLATMTRFRRTRTD